MPSAFVNSVSSFFFNATATPEIYTLSLHDALPISRIRLRGPESVTVCSTRPATSATETKLDRKSTRLNFSHRTISYAVFGLKKKTRQLNSFYNPGLDRTNFWSQSVYGFM